MSSPANAALIASARSFASSTVPQPRIPLGVYQHYKNRELYLVRGTVRHTETEEDMVLYQACYTSKGNPGNNLFVRPLAMFTENVEHQGATVPRFALLERDDEIKTG